jgi:hypothetical protein
VEQRSSTRKKINENHNNTKKIYGSQKKSRKQMQTIKKESRHINI